MKTILISLLISFTIMAQSYEVVKVKGEVKYQEDMQESWHDLKAGNTVSGNSVIETGSNSSVQLKSENIFFRLNEVSAVTVSSIKQLSRDELLLALALEDLMNVPEPNEGLMSGSTAVYGTKEDGNNPLFIRAENFGIKRLNGAVQLAESGLEASAVIAAKETYRKYPDVKSIPSYRIFFAGILSGKGLYEEALTEILEIQTLNLSEEQSLKVSSMREEINKKLLNE